MAEELQYGKPNLNYDSDKKEGVSVRSPSQSSEVTLAAAVNSKFSVGDWVAIYTGDYQGVVQLKRVKQLKESNKVLEFDAALQFPVSAGDTVEKVTDFNVKEMWPIPGIVSFDPALEIGQIADDSLGGGSGSGERVPGSPRRGNVNGEGGSLVVQPGIEGFARLLRHAVGRVIDYSAYPEKSGSHLDTAINKVSGYAPGATQITVDAITNAAVIDWVLVGVGKLTAEPVKLSAVSGSDLTFTNTPLRNEHANDEVVHELDITEGTTLLTKEIRKSNLPSGMTLYAWHSDLQILEVITGVKVSSMSLSVGTAEETIKATFNLISKAGQLISRSTLPFSVGNAVKHIPYTNPEAYLTKDGVRIVGLQSGDLTVENEITVERSMDGTGTISSAPEDVGDVSISLSAQLFDSKTFEDAIKEAKRNYALKIEYTGGSDGEALEFYFPNSVVSGNQLVPVSGGGGIIASFNLTSGVDATKNTQMYAQVKSKEVRIF